MYRCKKNCCNIISFVAAVVLVINIVLLRQLRVTAFTIYPISKQQLLKFSNQSIREQYPRNKALVFNIGSSSNDDISQKCDHDISIQALTTSSKTTSTETKMVGAEFEYQEMKVLLSVIESRQVVSANQLDPLKAIELNTYIQKIVSNRRLIEESSNGQQLQRFLPRKESLLNTTWNMIYTTMEFLPRDTTIQLQFSNYSNDQNSSSKMQYRLLFGSKTFGLQSINVQCSDWDVRPATTTTFFRSPSLSLSDISFIYDTLSVNAFGKQNIPLCFVSNLLKGRSNRIHTVYFDDTIWIEQQEHEDEQRIIWNVYRKQIQE